MQTTETLIHFLDTHYAELSRALVDARRLLLYGTGDFGPYNNETKLGSVGEMMLREIVMVRRGEQA